MEPMSLESLESMLAQLPVSDKEQLCDQVMSYLDSYLDFQEQRNKLYRPDAHRQMVDYLLHKTKLSKDLKTIIALVD